MGRGSNSQLLVGRAAREDTTYNHQRDADRRSLLERAKHLDDLSEAPREISVSLEALFQDLLEHSTHSQEELREGFRKIVLGAHQEALEAPLVKWRDALQAWELIRGINPQHSAQVIEDHVYASQDVLRPLLLAALTDDFKELRGFSSAFLINTAAKGESFQRVDWMLMESAAKRDTWWGESFGEYVRNHLDIYGLGIPTPSLDTHRAAERALPKVSGASNSPYLVREALRVAWQEEIAEYVLDFLGDALSSPKEAAVYLSSLERTGFEIYERDLSDVRVKRAHLRKGLRNSHVYRDKSGSLQALMHDLKNAIFNDPENKEKNGQR